jgi:hypothetical protein
MKKQNKRSTVDLSTLEQDIRQAEADAGESDGSAAYAQYRAALVARIVSGHFGDRHDVRVYPKANGYGVVMMLRRPLSVPPEDRPFDDHLPEGDDI